MSRVTDEELERAMYEPIDPDGHDPRTDPARLPPKERARFEARMRKWHEDTRALRRGRSDDDL